jgi:hypothetical protein
MPQTDIIHISQRELNKEYQKSEEEKLEEKIIK